MAHSGRFAKRARCRSTNLRSSAVGSTWVQPTVKLCGSPGGGAEADLLDEAGRLDERVASEAVAVSSPALEGNRA